MKAIAAWGTTPSRATYTRKYQPDMWLQPCARVGLCRAQLCVLFKSSRAQPCAVL